MRWKAPPSSAAMPSQPLSDLIYCVFYYPAISEHAEEIIGWQLDIECFRLTSLNTGTLGTYILLEYVTSRNSRRFFFLKPQSTDTGLRVNRDPKPFRDRSSLRFKR